MVAKRRTGTRGPLLRGIAAALASGLAMMVARVALDARTPIDMVFDLSGHLLGVPAVFNLVHALPWGLGDYAKYALFALMGVLYVAAWAVAALALARLGSGIRVVVPVVASVALVGLVLLPAEGLGVFGLSSDNYFYPPASTHLWAAVFGLVYGLVLALGGGARPRRFVPIRRDVLDRGGRAILFLAFGGALVRAVLGSLARATGLDGLLARIEGLSAPITPTAEHYVVSKNFINPKVDASRWSLRVRGLVDQPLELTLADLEALPSIERPTTLTCVSNEVGGDLIGTSLWTGVPLGELLAMAGVKPEATEIVLRGADNYTDSIPLEVGLRDGNMVAYHQNGEPLTRDHGFPARLLVPGIYGMKNVKWLVDVELTDQDVQGFWQQRGWSDTAVVQTMSRIDTRRATDLGDGTFAIGGVAFAGIRGVEAVEVSVDDGATWQRATLTPAANGLSWNLWGFRWQAEKGTYVVAVRAIDGEGATQTSDARPPLPAGATGWHKLRVTVG